MKCQSCGRELNGNEKFCNGCGCPVNAYPDNNPYYNSGYQPNSNNQQYNFNNQGGNNKNNNKLIIIISVIAVVLIAAAVIIFVCLSSNDDEKSTNNTSGNKTNNISVNTKNDYSEDIEYEIFEVNGEDWIKFKNTSSEALDIEMNVKFYDKDKKPVGSDKVYAFCLDKGATYYDKLYITADYDSYEVDIEAEKAEYSKSLKNEKFEIVDNVVSDDIYVEIRNNTSYEISNIELLIKYYKNGKLVALDTNDDYRISPDKTASFEFYVPYGENYKLIEYDKIEYEILTVYYDDYDE